MALSLLAAAPALQTAPLAAMPAQRAAPPTMFNDPYLMRGRRMGLGYGGSIESEGFGWNNPWSYGGRSWAPWGPYAGGYGGWGGGTMGYGGGYFDEPHMMGGPMGFGDMYDPYRDITGGSWGNYMGPVPLRGQRMLPQMPQMPQLPVSTPAAGMAGEGPPPSWSTGQAQAEEKMATDQAEAARKLAQEAQEAARLAQEDADKAAKAARAEEAAVKAREDEMKRLEVEAAAARERANTAAQTAAADAQKAAEAENAANVARWNNPPPPTIYGAPPPGAYGVPPQYQQQQVGNVPVSNRRVTRNDNSAWTTASAQAGVPANGYKSAEQRRAARFQQGVQGGQP